MEEVFGRFALALSPFVQVWLEEALVELGHGPEGSSAVEEVELLVVLLVDLWGIAHDLLTLHFFDRLTINLNFLGFR